MPNNRAVMQTLLDEFASAIVRGDPDKVSILRRTIDKKLTELFDEIARLRATTPPRNPQAPRPASPPPPPPRRPQEIPRQLSPCPHCAGTGRVEEGNAILRCCKCGGYGTTELSPGGFI